MTIRILADENRGLSKPEDANNLNTLLRALATYTSGPYVKSELLDDTRSLKDVRRVFLRFLEIEVTDHSLLNYQYRGDLTRDPLYSITVSDTRFFNIICQRGLKSPTQRH